MIAINFMPLVWTVLVLYLRCFRNIINLISNCRYFYQFTKFFLLFELCFIALDFIAAMSGSVVEVNAVTPLISHVIVIILATRRRLLNRPHPMFSRLTVQKRITSSNFPQPYQVKVLFPHLVISITRKYHYQNLQFGKCLDFIISTRYKNHYFASALQSWFMLAQGSYQYHTLTI